MTDLPNDLPDDLRGVRVAVVGAGLGGLCLAQGLKRAGVQVAVYERDAELNARRQGYRLHLDARAGLALQRCLPPELFALFLATCGGPSTRVTVMNERLRVLHETRPDPAGDPLAAATLSTSVNRQTLREILAIGLDERLHFDAELTGYRDGPPVTLCFSDGSQASADIVVGADGVGSVVRRQRLPGAQVRDTGGRCIYGKTTLDDSVLTLLPAALTYGFTAVVGGDIGLASGLVRLRDRPERVDARLSPVADYLMWAVSGRVEAFPVGEEQISRMSPTALHGLAAAIVRPWHPTLRTLVERAVPDETFLVRVTTSTPVEAWVPSRVTLVGDAIHAMSPARGSGANTALQDAGVLCRLITASSPGGLTDAIGDYERQMRQYGFAAVQASQDAEAQMGARRHRVWFWLGRHVPPASWARARRQRGQTL